MRRPRDLVVAASALAAIATLMGAADAGARLVFDSAAVRLALHVAEALIAGLVAYLVYGRFRRRRLLGELVLVYALTLLATTNLFFALLPELDLRTDVLTFQTWVPTGLRLVAAIAIVTAALLRDHRIRRVEQPGVWMVVATAATVAVAAIAGAVGLHDLPAGITVTGGTVEAPTLEAHPLLLGAELLTALLFGVASVGFVRRAERRPDPLAAAMAVGSALGAFASLSLVVYPSMETTVIQSSDWLRLGFYLVLLIGAEREIDRYWGQLAAVAVYEERRRLARELHDGVAQELAFVVTQTRRLSRGDAAPGTDQLVAAAAERALDESRRAITALTGDTEEPLHLAIARAVEDVAGRVGVQVQVEASPAVRVTPTVREALVRIARESVSNAGRHGDATHVSVTLTDDGVLRITDDGTGFSAEDIPQGRFGLLSMRERAEQLGARFQVESQPGRGTSVEVALP